MAYLLIAAVFEALAVYLFQFRKIPGAMMLVFCQICKGIWIAARAFCSMSPDLPTKLLWARFAEWAPLLLIYFWFEFILEVSQQKGRLTTALKYAVRGITAALVAIIGFDSSLGWYYGPVSLTGNVLTIAFGPAAWVTMVFCYALNVVCILISLGWIYRTKGLRRQQAIALSVTPVFNFVGSMVGYASNFQAVPPQVIGLLLSAIYVTWVFYRWRVYSILPLAQDAVTKSMIDGLMVVDEKGYIVDMNPAAQAILAGLPAAVGGKFVYVAEAWPALAEAVAVPDGGEASRGQDESRFYHISTIPLATPQGDPLGRTLVFKDITQRKRDQQRLLESEKALAILTERERLGRELHDAQGQFPAYVKTHTQAVRLLLQKGRDEEADRHLSRLADAADEAFADVRESIASLKTASGEWDFFKNLAVWLSRFEKSSGIATEYSGPESRPAKWIAPAAEVQLLRIVQEVMVNTRKHSGAGRAEVVISTSDERLTLTIADNGQGFDTGQSKNGGYGLRIIGERAAEIGGSLEIRSATGQGTTVTVVVPLFRATRKAAQ
ncbi:histidine kinase N-terminal 7TM domain-containing protein [Anaeroselena agilis]|uniref:Oxygen sensor histidine kinase NreB n=1 Tax=Anaeroselena agilis TaxID=3063788 RepID=A0ABU3NU14_9FIRM|nr:histidine kinase N-terminal 7TM domain-containing protein [Selenomonadales bacterium 4137-cl]